MCFVLTTLQHGMDVAHVGLRKRVAFNTIDTAEYSGESIML